MHLIASASVPVFFVSISPSVSFCFSFISLSVSVLLPCSLNLSGFVLLAVFLLLCQCDRRRCKTVPVGSVDKTVDSVLAGTVRVLVENKTLFFAWVCVSVRCVLCVSLSVSTVHSMHRVKSGGKGLPIQHSPCDILQWDCSVIVVACCRMRQWLEVFCFGAVLFSRFVCIYIVLSLLTEAEVEQTSWSTICAKNSLMGFELGWTIVRVIKQCWLSCCWCLAQDILVYSIFFDHST